MLKILFGDTQVINKISFGDAHVIQRNCQTFGDPQVIHKNFDVVHEFLTESKKNRIILLMSWPL